MGKSPYFPHVLTVLSGDFEWDDAKAQTNLAKHGVGFDEAAAALDSYPDELTLVTHRVRTRSSCRFAPESFSW
jgi:hypothetical protein